MESHINSKSNNMIHFQLFTELIDIHKKRVCKQRKHILLTCGIFIFIGFLLFITSYLIPECKNSPDQCSLVDTLLFSFGITIFGFAIFLTSLICCVWPFYMKRLFKGLDYNEIGGDMTVWKFDGDEWIRFLNYISGPNRKGTNADYFTFFCCRRQSYEELINRQYGHVILYRNGFVIDQLYFVPFRRYNLVNTELKNFNEDLSILGLRFQTYLQAGKYSRMVYFDIFAPSSIPRSQLMGLVYSYNRKKIDPAILNMDIVYNSLL
ncbi:unnamed protein product [Adineta ricciae]|nr:unnamed protein product [Adineta ricciae]